MTSNHLSKSDTFNSGIAVAKGIGIILMVIGHSGLYGCFYRWIYTFHMPLFFFLSGYLLKDIYFEKPFRFLKNKIRGYYLPFLKWVIPCVILHNVFAEFHLNSTFYTDSNFLHFLSEAICFRNYEGIVGGLWFLREIFWASIISLGILLILNQFSFINKTISFGRIHVPIWYLLLVPILIISAYFISLSKSSHWTVTLLSICFFLSGYVYKRWELKSNLTIGILCISIGILIAYLLNFDFSMLGAYGKKAITSVPFGLIGIWGVLNLLPYIGTRLTQLFTYLGQKTLPILTMHFFCFKVVSFFFIISNSYNINRLAEHPVINNASDWAWIVYSIVGIGLPIFIDLLVHKLKTSCIGLFRPAV